jgi:hypothetical protein
VSAHSFAELDFTDHQLQLQAWDRTGARIDALRLPAQSN